jgi:hypothetical protein
MINYKGTIVEGSAAILTSVGETEILPTGKHFINFQLLNDQACTIAINNGTPIYVRALQGISIDVALSVKIQQDNITFNWIGTRG